MKQKRQKLDLSKLFYAYEIVHRPDGKKHYLVNRFLTKFEQERWILDGVEVPTYEMRFNSVEREKVRFSSPMVQLAIQYEFWPIRVVAYPDGTCEFICDASTKYMD